MDYILILVAVVGAMVLSVIFRGRRDTGAPCKSYRFRIDANNPTVVNYVARMDDQHKFNSRVLNGTGKMHYVDVVSSGSTSVRESQVSVIKNLGDRFS